MTDDSSPDDIFLDDDPYHPPYAPRNEERFDTLRQEIWYQTRWGVSLSCAALLLVAVHAWNQPVTGLTDQLMSAAVLAAIMGIGALFSVKLVRPFYDVPALAARLTPGDTDRETPDSDTTEAHRE